MITRAEAATLVNGHLDHGYKAILPEKYVKDREGNDLLLYDAQHKKPFHYGRVEIRALLDAIYGGPPNPNHLEEHIKA